MLRRSYRFQAAVFALLTPGLLVWNQPLQANPHGGVVVHGDVQIGAGAGGNLQILQNSQNAIIDWQGFSISAGELTQFLQPGSSSAVLNRVTGGDPSAIHGALRANGNVFLINPSGILVGPSGSIDVHGLVLSTLDVDNGEFLARGDMVFKGGSDKGVTNLGRISAIGGDVFLIGRTVTNSGTVKASQGRVGLAAGEEVLLKADTGLEGERVFVRAKGAGASGTGILNDGTIEGAAVELKAHGNLYALAINNKGSVRATGAENTGGRVYLRGAGGGISNSGSIEASASVGSGGRVLIEAAYAKVDGQIKAEGGHVRIAATEKADLGGSIDVSDPSALSDSSDLSVIVESREISVGSTAAIDASGATGGGSINIGGGFQGRDVTIRNAESLVIDDGATIRADALTSGNGGQVILWSGGDTTFRGSISAQALGNGGNGGFVEVSGKEGLLYDGTVSTLAANGRSGTLLLDPSDFSIVVSGAGPNSMTSADLIAALNTTGSMVISTSGTGGTGDITVEAGANVNWNSANSLSLLAHRHIVVGANIQNSGSGGINLVAGWDGTTMPTSFPAASYGDLNGTITISGAAVGSRMGHTFAAGYRMELIGGSAAARLGYYDTGSNAINGAITANLKSGGLTLQGGSATGSAAQIGHVGQSNAAATTGGAINVDVTGIGAIALTGGTGEDSYAQIGHGARANTATKSGNISVTTASGGLELKAGGTVASSGQGAHALIGHGGRDSTNTIANSNITVDIGGSIGITAGVSGTAVNRHAQIGHGGLASSGTFSGIIDVKSGGNITLQGGNTGYAYAQIGHGGRNGSGSHSGEIKVFAQGSVRGYTSTLAGGNDAWAMIGHGGRQTVPATVGTGHGGDITVTAQTGNIDFKGGLAEGNVARIGHGGGNSQGDFWGRIVVNAATGISFTGGGGTNAYAQIGHGGAYSNGVNYTGNITGQIDIALTTAANTGIHLAGGSGGGSYAKIGHGGFHNATDTSNGSITGGIFVNYDSVGDVATGFAGRINLQGSGINSFAQIGHGGTNRRGNMAGDVILGRVGDVELKGSTGAGSFAHIGHGGVAPNAAVLGGKITVNAAGNVALLAGNSTSAAYAMIGHGGGLSYGDKSGDISVTSSAGTLFRIVGGGGNDNFAMIGHGGLRGDATNKGGNTIGNIVVQATNASLTMTGGASGSRNFVKIGHGGYMGDVDVNSTLQGSINATFGGNAEIRGGGGVSFAQVGHGSVYANYTDANDPNYSRTALSGSIVFTTAGKFDLIGGAGGGHALLGHGGQGSYGLKGGVGQVVQVTASEVRVEAHETAGGAFAQIGHGGNWRNGGGGIADITVKATSGSIVIMGGGRDSHAMIGHGGLNGQSGTFSGNIVVEALLGDLTMTGRTGKNAFAKIGHAAFSTSSGSSGTILVTVGGNISMKSGGSTTLDMDHADNVNHYTQIGHGWEQGSASDSITVTAGGSLTMHGGIGRNSHSIIGHSAKAGTTLSGAITLNITGATEMKAGPGRDSYVVIGHDSRGTGNTLSGAIVLNTANLVMVGGYLHSANIAGASVTGLRSYARIGHGGYDAGGTFSDKIEVNSLGSISLTGGSDAVGQYAQIGHGGRGANATMSGDVVVLALGGDLTLQGGGTTDSYAMIGHGSDMNSAGTRQGSMHLFARGTLSATDGTGTNSRAHVAHQSGNGLAAANYLGGTGYQLRGSSAVNVAGASLAGVETMINANLATGPVQVAVDKVIDFAITGTAATRNAADLMYIVTGGAISFQRSYQNTGAGGVALVAGWDGATGLPGNVAFTQFGTIDTNAIATAGAFARGAKGVTLGATGQGNSVAVGGKTGDTFVAGHFVNLYGGNSGTAYAQIGYRAVVQDDDATGNVSVEAGAGGVLLQGGGTSNAYVQIGHGGLLTGTNSLTKQLSGNISVRADRGSATVGDVRVLSGSATSYAHIGHGGQWNNGTFGGNILVTGNAITIQSTRRYAQIGHGGLYANGAFTGDIDVNYLRGSDPTTPGTVVGGGGLLKIQAGNGTDDYAMLGHGGVVSSGGIRSGDIHVGMSSGIEVKGGIWRTVYGQIGHGGYGAGAYALDGDITLHTTGDILLQAGVGSGGTVSDAQYGYAQVGHGGIGTSGVKKGDIKVTSTDGSSIQLLAAGANSFNQFRYAQIGHGGSISGSGAISGTIVIDAKKASLSLTGGANGSSNYAQIGHGGSGATSSMSDDITLTLGGDVSLKGGGDASYAQIGHGGLNPNASELTGNIRLETTGNIDLLAGSSTAAGAPSFAMIGHGGATSYGKKEGSIHIVSTEGTSLNLIAGSGANRNDNFAMIGHGGMLAGGSTSPVGGSTTGLIDIQALKSGLNVQAGASGARNFAKIGHGGYRRDEGSISGSIVLGLGGDVEIKSGGTTSYAQIGHGAVYHGVDQSDSTRSLVSLSGSIDLHTTGKITMQGGQGSESHAMIGHGGRHHFGNKGGVGESIKVEGASVEVLANTGSSAFAQIGHGGAYRNGGNATATIEVKATTGDVVVQGGGYDAYAMIGHGGLATVAGTYDGSVTVRAESGDVRLVGSTGKNAYAKIGHGGYGTNTLTKGGIEVFAGRDLLMRGGGTTDMANADNINTFAQIGHGWDTANASGTIHVTVRRDLDMKGGVGKQAHALIGHASRGTVALSDKITVNVTGATTMTAGSGEDDYVKIGHAARSGTVTAGGEICFNTASLVMTAGTGADGKRAFAQIGHGGYGVTGPFSGKIVVSSLAGISMNGGAGADGQYVQIGHGGVSSAGAMSGDVYVIAQGGDLLLQGGGAANAYAMIGHGADTTSSGTRQGGIHLFADGTITAADGTGSNSRAHVIHRSGSGLSDANYLGGGDGFQLVSNGGASYSNASLEGVGVMASRNFDAGVSFAFSNDIDIVINSGAQITVNTDRDLVMMTGGNLTVNRSYQNAGTGGVVLVAGWRGGGSFSGGRVEFQGVGFCQPTIVSSTAAGFNGCGNFGLGADGVSARSLVVGSASQTAALRIGSRGGQNTFAGYGVTLNAGAASAPTQLGYHHTNASDTGAITGGLAVQVRGGGLTLKGGANDAHAQIGHSSSVVVDIDADIAISFCEPGDLRLDGGAAANAYAKIGHGANVAGGNLSGDVVIGSPTGKAGAVFLNSGNASGAYTQIGHGGSYGTINSIGLSGSIALHATGALEMTSKAGGQSYTMIGHGGRNSLGEKGGADESIVVSAASVAMTAAGGHAMIGHGSQWQAGGNITGDISVTATAGSIRVQGGGRDAFASIGHGGLGTSTAGAMTGDITVKATGGGLYLTAGTNAADNKNSYARVGHGAFSVNGHLSGDIDVDVDGDIVMHSGGDTRNNHADNVNAHTQIGHGGHRPDTSDGTIRIRAGGDMEMLAGIGAYSYSMVGHGGWGDSGASVGEISLAVGGDLTMTSGSGEDAFTQIGHGGSNRPGNHVGDLSVYVGGDLAVNGGTHATRTDAVIGHGGRTVAGNHTGHIRLRVLGDTSLTDGTGGWAMLGHVGTGTVLANSDFSFVTGSLSSVGANYGLGNTISRHYASNRVDIGVQQGDLLIAGSAATASHAHDLNLFAGGSVTIATRMQNMANGNVSIIGGWDGTTGLLQNLDLARLPVLTQLQLSPDTVMADVSAFGAGASLVNIGTGSHAAGIAVGSKNGRTLAAANGVRVTGSTAAEIYSLLGYHTDATNDTTVGRVVVEAKESGVTVQGGGTGAYAQIGHGGSGGNTNLKNLGGDISVRADRGSVVGDVRVLSGTGDRANAQIGLGGRQNDGSHTGRIVVIGAGVEVRSGAGSAQIGHGGFQGTGTYTGDVFINFDPDANGGAGAVRGGGGDLIVQAGDGFDDFAMIGHGGVVANGGPRSGNIRIGEAANVFVHAGSNRSATAQIGHAGVNNGNLELKGDIDIHTSGNLSLKGGFGAVSNLLNFAQIGHGGAAATGVKTGNINITALGTSVLLAAGTNTQGTEGSHAQIGHGGDTSGGNATGTITLLAPNALVELEGGTWIRNHAKIGHGGYNSTGNYTGSIDLLAGAGLSLTGGSGTDAFAQVGHGGAHSNGDMGGDIRVRSGGDLLMQGGTNANDTDVLIGHGFVGTTGTRSGNVSIRTEGTTSLLEGAAARALLGHAGSGSGAGSTDFAFVTDRLVQSTVLYGLGDTIAMMLPRGAIDIGVRQGDLRIDGVGGIANSAKAIDLFAGGNVVLNSQAQNSGAGSASIVAGWDGATGLVEQYPTSTTAPVIVVLGLEIADVLADDASWGNGGKVTVGDGAQAAVGSAGGATTVLGHAVDVRGSSGGYALIGSLPASGVSPTGDITVKAKEGGIAVEAGNGTGAYAQIGHRAQGSLVSALSGRILVDSGAGLALKGGAGLLSYAQIGHGGNSGDVGSIGGAVTVNVADDIDVIGGSGSGAYSQIGHGGLFTKGSMADDIEVNAGGNILLSASDPDFFAYAKIGHGDDVRGGGGGTGDRDGDIVLTAGGDIELESALVGHVNGSGSATAIGGKTWIGAARSAPDDPAAGKLVADAASEFSGFEEVRFYLPRRANNEVAAGAKINGEIYDGGVADPQLGLRPDEYTNYTLYEDGTLDNSLSHHDNTLGSGPAPMVSGLYAFYYDQTEIGTPPVVVVPGGPGAGGNSGNGGGSVGGGGKDPSALDYWRLLPDDRTRDKWLRDQEREYSRWGGYGVYYEGYPQYGPHGESVYQWGRR